MEITPDQKALLQLVDTDIEASFSGGVTQAGPYLPALPMYDRIKPADRKTGRQGILSTFAGFLARLASFNPPKTLIAFQNNFDSYNTQVTGFGGTPVDEDPSYHKDVTGEIVLMGKVICPVTAGSIVITQLPVGFRPAKNRTFSAVLSDVGTSVHVNSDGTIFCTDPTTAVDWLSLDGIRFRPA